MSRVKMATIDPDFDETDLQSSNNPTLAQQIYASLEEDILLGKWLPGSQRSLRKLASQFDTSMQPVREAIGKLVGASALEIEPGRSVRVRRLERGEADEVWAMRMLLEGESAARFAQRNVPEQARQLYRFTDQLREAYDERDVLASMRSILDWNLALTNGADSPLLAETILQLRLRYVPFIAQTLALDIPFDHDFIQFTLHIQDELVYAIETGDSASARHLRASDLRSFQRYLYSRCGW